jgi:delta24-sterol reductase
MHNRLSSATEDSSNSNNNLIINCGIYGRVSDGKGRDYTELLERKCQQLGGRKMLYAQNFYSEDNFWEIYGDKHEYDRLRDELDASYFPYLYEKVCPNVSQSHPVVKLVAS